MAELTEEEYAVLSSIVEVDRQNRESSLGVHYSMARTERNARAVDSLLAKEYIREYGGAPWASLGITKAGVRAMAEHTVRKQFADLDRIVNVDGPGSKMSFVYLERIVRDQARRIAELEAKG